MKRLWKLNAICIRVFVIHVFSNIISKPYKLLNVNSIKIIPIAFVFIPGLIFLNCEKALSQTILSDEEIGQTRHLIATSIKELYTQRTNQPDTLFRMEPELNEVAGILCSDTFQIRHAEVDKTLIRELLHAQFIYDYQVHYIKIPLKSLNSSTIAQQIKEHERVKEIIENPFANRIGIDIEAVNDKNIAHLLISERYIDIDEDRLFIISSWAGGGDTYEEFLTGKSYIDNLYYNNLSQKVTNNDLIIEGKKEVKLDPENRFSIHLIGDQNIFFIDENGKILTNRVLKFSEIYRHNQEIND